MKYSESNGSYRYSRLGAQSRFLRPISTVTANQLAVHEKMIRVSGDEHGLYGAVDAKANEILHVSLFPATTKQTARGFLAELLRRYCLIKTEFLVDGASYFGTILAEDGYRLQGMTKGNRNAI